MNTSTCRVADSLVLIMLGHLTIGAVASGQDIRTELRSSRWDTTYTTPDGSRQRAIVTINGNSGRYDAIDASGRVVATGQLSKLQVDANPQTQKFFMIGQWRFQNGQSGRFTFTGDANRFSGGYGYGEKPDGGGSWTGRRIAEPPAGGGANVGQGQVTYGAWQFNDAKGYYFRTCAFPAGANQYLICYPGKTQWVYWYNPASQVFWCACPTARHPEFGRAISQGQDLFLMASTKGRTLDDTTFPDNVGANLKKGVQAKDRDGSMVSLGCPPADLPADLP